MTASDSDKILDEGADPSLALILLSLLILRDAERFFLTTGIIYVIILT